MIYVMYCVIMNAFGSLYYDRLNIKAYDGTLFRKEQQHEEIGCCIQLTKRDEQFLFLEIVCFRSVFMYVNTLYIHDVDIRNNLRLDVDYRDINNIWCVQRVRKVIPERETNHLVIHGTVISISIVSIVDKRKRNIVN